MIPILVTLPILFAQAAPPAVQTSRLEGRVVNSANGEAVPKATVLLHKPQGFSYAETTDGSGHFAIENVEPGEYAISADRQGFFLENQGAPGAPPPRIKIESGKDAAAVIVRLIPLGVIAGRLTDPDGDPVRGVTVSAMQFGYVAGKKQLRSGQQVQANDKGEFRLFDLRPGTYFLQATKRNPEPTVQDIRGPRPPAGFAATFFPSTADAARAVPIQLTPGAQLRGMDIRLRPEAVYSIRFKVSSAESSSYSPMIISADQPSPRFGSSVRMTRDTLEFPGLLPGSYVVTATRSEGGQQSFARQEVQVSDADVDGGPLTFLPPADISGTARIEGSSSRTVQSLHVTLQPQGPSTSGAIDADVKPDGSFAIHGVAPNVYRVLMAEGPGGLYVKSIRTGDQDLADRRIDLTHGTALAPLTIVLAGDTGEIEGSVQKSSGEPAVRVRVNAIPYGDHLGRGELSRFIFTDDKGHFLIKNVAPGEYKVFAWEDVDIGAPQDPEFRKPFEKQSASVKMAPNGHETVQLTAIVTKTTDQ